MAPCNPSSDTRRHRRPSELATVFDFALKSDRDEIRRAVQNGGDDVGRLFRLGVELSDAQALHLGRQIRESVDRRRRPQTEAPDTDKSVDYEMPVVKAPLQVPVNEVSRENKRALSRDVGAPNIDGRSTTTDVVAAPISRNRTDEASKPSGGGRLAAVV